jgi:hypothetical protein
MEGMMSKVEKELAKHAAYKLPDFMHPDTPRGPDVTAIDRQAQLTALAAKLQSRQTAVVKQCYAVAPGGTFWNIDVESGRILFGLPWAEHSHRAWGLVRSECDLMRLCIRHFRKVERGPFYFDKTTTRWFVDVARYPTLETVQAVPQAWVITPALLVAADNHRRGLPHGAPGTGRNGG